MVAILNRFVSNANWSNPENTNCVDPNLFSVAVKDKRLSEDSFLALVEYMKANAIPIPDVFFLNAFKSLLCAKENINSVLDIIAYFSKKWSDADEDWVVDGIVWRRMMAILQKKENPEATAFTEVKGHELPNRYSLFFSLVEMLQSDFHCISLLC